MTDPVKPGLAAASNIVIAARHYGDSASLVDAVRIHTTGLLDRDDLVDCVGALAAILSTTLHDTAELLELKARLYDRDPMRAVWDELDCGTD